MYIKRIAHIFGFILCSNILQYLCLFLTPVFPLSRPSCWYHLQTKDMNLQSSEEGGSRQFSANETMVTKRVPQNFPTLKLLKNRKIKRKVSKLINIHRQYIYSDSRVDRQILENMQNCKLQTWNRNFYVFLFVTHDASAEEKRQKKHTFSGISFCEPSVNTFISKAITASPQGTNN